MATTTFFNVSIMQKSVAEANHGDKALTDDDLMSVADRAMGDFVHRIVINHIVRATGRVCFT